MKHIICATAFAFLAGGCATTPPVADGAPAPAAQQNATNMPADPTYPGPGVNIGIGLGRWGSHGGGGIGVGYGW